MRLISLNTGLYEKNNAALERFFRCQMADIVCLQEVTRKVETTANSVYISKPAIDKGTDKLPHAFYAPLWQTNSHKTTNYHNDDKYRLDWGGILEFGNYVKSRYPIIYGENVFVENHFSYVLDWTTWPDKDYRAVQLVDLLVKNKHLRLLNYHGIWTRDKQGNRKTLKACKVINELAGKANGAVVIAGDFNLFPDTESIRVLNSDYRNLTDEYGVRTTRPESNELHSSSRNVVDYIFVNDSVNVESFSVNQNLISDHLALILDFSFH